MTILVQQQMTEANRKQLREICDKATQGDWWIDSHGHRMVSRPRFDTVFEASSSMGPAVRHPETGNLSHWPNDWDATYIVAAQPKVVRGLLDEIDRLNALVIERETIRIGQSLQRHDDQKQMDELVALGIQQDKDEIVRLKVENERWQQNYEHLIEQHMPRTGDGCEEGWSRVVEARELQAQLDQLKAENGELVNLMRRVVAEHPRRNHKSDGNGPGHGHRVPGVWDEDNGELAGKPCAWCSIWNAAKGIVERHDQAMTKEQP